MVLLFSSSLRLCCCQSLPYLILILITFVLRSAAESPMSLHGGSILAMAGDDCVAVAMDKRNAHGSSLIHVAPRRILSLPKCIVACTGLHGDVQSLQAAIATESVGSCAHQLPQQQQGLSARAVASLTSHLLYQRRRSPYYVEPVIVGLGEKDNIPYLCSMDCIGARSESAAFCCTGAATASLLGAAEALWRPHCPPNQLVALTARAFLQAMERDSLSGYGAVIYLVTPEGVIEYDVAGRSD